MIIPDEFIAIGAFLAMVAFWLVVGVLVSYALLGLIGVFNILLGLDRLMYRWESSKAVAVSPAALEPGEHDAIAARSHYRSLPMWQRLTTVPPDGWREGLGITTAVAHIAGGARARRSS